MIDDISIDRLVLEVPGIAADQAPELARRIGAQLAASTAGPGEFEQIAITLDAGHPDAKQPDLGRLANSVVSALLRRIG